MTKSEKLKEIEEKMQKDNDLPLKRGATRLVFGVGNPESEIVLVGEGPGYWEDQKGEPFVGNAGKLLDQLLASINYDRTRVYITNVVHHRPPENRDPEPSEIEAYGKYLDEMLDTINPKVILTLGRFSMAKFLPEAKISAVHGRAFSVNWRSKSLVVVPMYHPAAALRSGEVMRSEKEDFLKLPEILKSFEEKSQKEKVREPDAQQMNLI